MLDIKVEFQPKLENIADAFKSVDLANVIRSITDEFAFVTERYAKQVTPVDTGRLRASIAVSTGFGNNFRSFVQTNTNYAIFVHEGTSRMRGRPFMRWGMEFALQKLSGNDIAWRLDDELRKQLSRL